MDEAARLKELAAQKALESVSDGMLIGLGTGSTTAYFIAGLGELIREQGMAITGVPTSQAAEALARKAGIPLTELDPACRLDLTVDGADEVDPQLNLIKGLGGALLREKVVAAHSKLHITVVDDSKLTDPLGTLGPLPVEVVPFGHTVTKAQIEALGAAAKLRMENAVEPFVTDNGNYIYHCTFSNGLPNAPLTDRTLLALPGVVQTGLFIGLTHRVLVAATEGLREIRSEKGPDQGEGQL